jgi:predicted RND superfamily exporter protein
MIALPEPPVRRLMTFIHRHPYAVTAAALLLAGLCILLAGGKLIPGQKLGLKSNLQDLLPHSAPSVVASQVLEKRLGSADVLVVTLMTREFEQVKAALPEITRRIEALPDVRKARYKQDISMIDQNALIIFPTLPELRTYLEELTTEIQKAVKKELQLFDDDEKPGAEPAPEAVPTTLAWAEIETTDGLSELGRTFRRKRGDYREYFYNRDYTTIGIQVYPKQSSSDVDFSRKILAEVETTVSSAVTELLGPLGPEGVVQRVDLGGGYRNIVEQSGQVANDMTSSIAVCFALLSLVVVIAFRSIRAIFCVLVPLIVGTAWTLGFATLAVGYVNLITAFIFAVLLGLGIDFGIHYYGRYREERAAGHNPLEAMVITQVQAGSASILASTTTSCAFLALTLADFRGFSQFGLVAAVGVIVCWFAVVLVFSAVTFIFERWMPLKLMGFKVARGEDGGIIRGRFPLGGRTVVIATVLGLVGAVLGPAMVEFELDFNNLGPKVDKAKAEHEKIQYGTTQATAPAVIFTKSPQEATAIYEQLEERTDGGKLEHPRIKSYQSVFALVPAQQLEKKEQVKLICRKLKRKVKLFEGDAREGADELLKHCNPQEFTVEQLPDWVTEKFSDVDGRLGEFIFVSPRGSTNDGEVALAFREEMLSLKGLDGQPPVVSGRPMVWAEVIIAMKHDGLMTSIASLSVVLLLLFLFERKPSAVGMVFLPLGLGLGISAGIMALFGMKLNFFNMLAAPTLIGMGVDNGVHMYHRYKELGPGSALYIVKHTGLSAALATITTCIGFGSLWAASNRGLVTLGTLTVIGMMIALLATLVVLPAAMQWMDDRAARAKG